MKFLCTIVCALLVNTGAHSLQVPSPQGTSTNLTSGPSWTKTSSVDYQLKDANGNRLNNVKDLLYLDTETLSVLDKNGRKIYLLNDFKNAASGSAGSATLLADNIGKNFYITNPNSFGNFINDSYNSGTYANIDGSYVYYVEDVDATYYLKDIRKFENWGANSSQKLDYSSTNTYWYRDRDKGEFGVIKKGKSLDYDRVTSEKSGNDLIVLWDGVKTYLLPGYYTTASYVFKPVQMYSGGSSVTSGNSAGCVRGNCENGWGKYEYDGGGHYDGFWKNGYKNGYGLYKWEDGSKYIGNWENDTMSGYGVYLATNDDNIIGLYRDGQLNGLGVTVTNNEWEQGIFSDGSLVSKYNFFTNKVEKGCVAGDCESKYGRFVWDNGDKFVGFFKNGNMYMGTYTFANGGKYSGMFNKDNQFHGTGRYFFPDDAYYGGQWRDGKYHGLGYYHNKDLEQQIGEWSNGTLVRSMK